MAAPILVTGGTGTLGRQVVPLLRAAGGDVRVLSRTPRTSAGGVEYVAGDLLAGTGIEQAVSGVEVVVHLAGGPKGDDEATAALVAAARPAGVRHIVLISVIGADAVPLGYLRAKQGAETVLMESGIGFSIVRAAQFHDLTLKMVRGMTRLPVVPIPGGLRLQPVDSGEVADRIAELALEAPAGRVADLAGPRVHPFRELVDLYLTAHGKHRPKLPVRIPGRAGRAYRDGANLTLAGATVGRRTWEEFLAEDRMARDLAG
ncbi:SDR family oxidoreductase [Nocardioides sp. LHG3406-4]|uniref:SDR family oxidoreductase n=1 Tax=Nocardioides sp. LHG3406-4 TaxID=2804575 RepID=UPI003CF2D77C